MKTYKITECFENDDLTIIKKIITNNKIEEEPKRRYVAIHKTVMHKRNMSSDMMHITFDDFLIFKEIFEK